MTATASEPQGSGQIGILSPELPVGKRKCCETRKPTSMLSARLFTISSGLMSLALLGCVVGGKQIVPKSVPSAPQTTAVLIAVDRDEVPPSAMQEINGILAVSGGCFIVERDVTKEPFLLVWMRPTEVLERAGRIGVRQFSTDRFIGDHVRLTGTGSGPPSPRFANDHAIPAACRSLASFTVNGILEDK